VGSAEPVAAEHGQETGQAALPVDDEFIVLVEFLTGCPTFAEAWSRSRRLDAFAASQGRKQARPRFPSTMGSLSLSSYW
jgi:hypothetical protein